MASHPTGQQALAELLERAQKAPAFTEYEARKIMEEAGLPAYSTKPDKFKADTDIDDMALKLMNNDSRAQRNYVLFYDSGSTVDMSWLGQDAANVTPQVRAHVQDLLQDLLSRDQTRSAEARRVLNRTVPCGSSPDCLAFIRCLDRMMACGQLDQQDHDGMLAKMRRCLSPEEQGIMSDHMVMRLNTAAASLQAMSQPPSKRARKMPAMSLSLEAGCVQPLAAAGSSGGSGARASSPEQPGSKLCAQLPQVLPGGVETAVPAVPVAAQANQDPPAPASTVHQNALYCKAFAEAAIKYGVVKPGQGPNLEQVLQDLNLSPRGLEKMYSSMITKSRERAAAGPSVPSPAPTAGSAHL